ncbi:MAG TPA: hypothetical protein VK425_01340 [Acidimicrobiales bacterium]|nr:hypothetical protein [Acidimicrobiales bacterium]
MALAPKTVTAERHDPRVDPPTKKDRRRLLFWAGFLGITPVSMGVVVWAAVALNGNYPTVRAPVPHGWQAVPGIYASFSVPGDWSLQQGMSDSAGDVYYSGPGGSTGESVVAAATPPSPSKLPAIVGTYLVSSFRTETVAPCPLHGANEAWRYTFKLMNGENGAGILAWVKSTQSRVWLLVVASPSVTEKVLSTLTLAS